MRVTGWLLISLGLLMIGLSVYGLWDSPLLARSLYLLIALFLGFGGLLIEIAGLWCLILSGAPRQIID